MLDMIFTVAAFAFAAAAMLGHILVLTVVLHRTDVLRDGWLRNRSAPPQTPLNGVPADAA